MKFAAVLILSLFAWTSPLSGQEVAQPNRIEFPSLDGLTITADLYQTKSDQPRPLIVLCHQAGWSRGEYREIAPKLAELGYDCLAIDQRSGKATGGVDNATAAAANQAGKSTGFLDAEQDLRAAIKYGRDKLKAPQLVLWGSSYSAALALRVAGEHPEDMDAVLAFAPGEYFKRFGKPADYIQQSASKIQVPAFITSARNELPQWEAIYKAIPGEQKTKFVPQSKGQHGSRALYARFDDSPAYWKAVKAFLKSLPSS